MNKTFGNAETDLAAYVFARYQPEDPLLRDIRERSAAAGLPEIQVAPLDGRHLELLVRLSKASKVVEIGTLGGYSGVSIARGLSPGGVLHTIEIDPRHAEVAAETFARAGVADRIRQWIGPALEVLPKLSPEGPFDFCFIDAAKSEYPNYLDWAAANLAPGGVVVGDNAFLFGQLPRALSPNPPAEVSPMDAFHSRLAGPEFRSSVFPTGEGLAVGVKL